MDGSDFLLQHIYALLFIHSCCNLLRLYAYHGNLLTIVGRKGQILLSQHRDRPGSKLKQKLLMFSSSYHRVCLCGICIFIFKQTDAFLCFQDSENAGIQDFLGNLSALSGFQNRIITVFEMVEITSKQYQVTSCLDCHNRSCTCSIIVLDGFHSHGICHDDTFEAQLFSYIAGGKGSGQCSRILRINGIYDYMTHHDAIHAIIDQLLKRNDIFFLQFFHALYDVGSSLMGICGDRTIAGEMFSHGQHAAILKSSLHGNDMLCHVFCILTEGCSFHGLSAGITEDVTDGRLNLVDSHGSEFLCSCLGHLIGQLCIVSHTKAHMAGINHGITAVYVRTAAALLVHGNDKGYLSQTLQLV